METHDLTDIRDRALVVLRNCLRLMDESSGLPQDFHRRDKMIKAASGLVKDSLAFTIGCIFPSPDLNGMREELRDLARKMYKTPSGLPTQNCGQPEWPGQEAEDPSAPAKTPEFPSVPALARPLRMKWKKAGDPSAAADAAGVKAAADQEPAEKPAGQPQDFFAIRSQLTSSLRADGTYMHVRQNRSGKWEAAISRKPKGWMYLGVHDSAELAAAAAQEYLGNRQEAELLRRLDAAKSPAQACGEGNYHGVTRTPAGTFKAQVYEPRRQRQKHLGTFRTELEAAIEVQKHLGNGPEVRRLRMVLIRRTEQELQELKGQGQRPGEIAIADESSPVVCNGCGKSFASRPSACDACGDFVFNPASCDPAEAPNT